MSDSAKPRITSGSKFRNEHGFSAIKDGVKRSSSHTEDNPLERKPKWLRARMPGGERYDAVRRNVSEHRLSTVCQESHCPNIGECWTNGTATIMVMGSVCTRACKFCAVDTGNPKGWLDPEEPVNTAKSVELMGLRYLMLHKPANVECTTKPGLYERAHDLIELPNVERLSIVGRLDVDTTGLVLMTDDGQCNHRVTSPKKACAKRYRVTLARPLEGDELARAVEDFDHGLMLDGEEKPTRPARLEMETATVGLLWITEGRYHQVKRMFAAIGNHVEALHREAIGAVELDPELEPGECRFLRPEEIASF